MTFEKARFDADEAISSEAWLSYVPFPFGIDNRHLGIQHHQNHNRLITFLAVLPKNNLYCDRTIIKSTHATKYKKRIVFYIF